ncbi:Chemotaxis protein CheW [Gemmata obscuriglobus]|uniref:Chemotaxis protein CheW n=1 Tax=Gemmata obscuriglobus TaxID=114 RepID=A0A2Z3HC09_9BACT|nr:chemotaxis protein CheW [Gemmata obscuriglobus]AWM40515.1 chemotaxis protein CheW [Gemmata obscuriglobus]QEG26238.1 Chemotaxis protein CheW [Gemmata obscuriglobus]VTS01003.1 purine-binding chemotaxis protein : Chemotaxis signal transduction protein CheW OS=Candidatus Nitrospira defluvii GN=cheW PE=4 SV=1: CheW [Gemmata obscuriglobus UQM 2246]
MDTNEPNGPPALSTGSGQFLTFRLRDEEFGVDLLRVQEIRGYSKVTALPNTPPEVRGVLNLRGAVIPILDLRVRFGLPPTEYTPFTVIVVVTVADKAVGLIVDAVSDVLNVGAKDVVPTPDLGTRAETALLTGIARDGPRLVSLINIDRLVGAAAPEPAHAF